MEPSDDEYLERLRPIIDHFSDEELDRLSRGEGPRLYVALDGGGLPVGGVIHDPVTGRTEMVPFPLRITGPPG